MGPRAAKRRPTAPDARAGAAVQPALPEFRLLRRRRVFAGELRGDRRQLLAMAIKPRLTGPGAFEIIAHIDPQPSEPGRFDLHHVAVHERIESAVIGAGGDEIARIEMMD